MSDAVIAWLWQFTAFRFLVVSGVAQTWSPRLSRWLAEETPLLVGLRQVFIDAGSFDLAAECSRELRRLGRL